MKQDDKTWAESLQWRPCTMREAIAHAQPRAFGSAERETGGWWYIAGDVGDAGVVAFQDGTAIACRSVWRGPYSEVTPDIDAEPPAWFIGTPKDGGK